MEEDRIKAAVKLSQALRKREHEKGVTSEAVKVPYLLAEYIDHLEGQLNRSWWERIKRFLFAR